MEKGNGLLDQQNMTLTDVICFDETGLIPMKLTTLL